MKLHKKGCFMFTGEFKHTLDTKNRISIPAKFREHLGETFYITKGLDHCLFVFSMEEWQKFEEKLSELPLSNKNARAFARTFFAGANECSTDKSGRTLIPQNLKDYAEIDKEVYINGSGSRIEIWNASRWTSYNENMATNMDELAENMESLGIRF